MDDEMYRLLKARAEGKIPNVPWREHETARQRAERWNAVWPNDPIAVPDEGKPTT